MTPADVYAVLMAEDGWTLAEVIEDVRREAAQEIREHIGTEDYPHETLRVRELVAFGRIMADVIDPEVSA